MSTDRELLELAAKAAGYKFRVSREWHSLGVAEVFIPNSGRKEHLCWHRWNPPEDDGDALRLRNALSITLIDEGDKVCAEFARYPTGGVVREPYERDLLGGFSSQSSVDAAVRLAITRAAAEIGRAMK